MSSSLFVSVCLFFNSSRSLLIHTFSPFCFQGFWSSLLSLFWIIFQVVCLFPLHWFGLLCFQFISFTCVAFLCLFFSFLFLKLLCLRSPFPMLQESWILSLKKVEFFHPFGFCPPKVGPVVCVSFAYGEICAEFLFVCFSSDGQGWVRW